MKQTKFKFKIKHYDDKNLIVYRKFYYTPRQAGLRGFLATLFAAVALFFLIPAPDDVLEVSAISKVLNHFFGIQGKEAFIYAYIIDEGVGVIFLCLSLLFGYEYVREVWARKKRELEHTAKTLTSTIQKSIERKNY